MGNFNGVERMMKKNLSYYSALVARRSSIDRDDAKQVLTIRLWKARTKYEHREGTSGKRYYLACIRREVDRILRDDRNAKQKFRRDALSLNSPINLEGDEIELMSSIPSCDDPAERIIVTDFLDSVQTHLDGRAKEVLTFMRLYGSDLDMAALAFRTSKQNICNIIRRRIRPIAKKILASDV